MASPPSAASALVAEDEAAAAAFLDLVDSAIVIWNASTPFADDGEFGCGAEIGIATGKLHARGSVGPEQLAIFKYVMRDGSGSGSVNRGAIIEFAAALRPSRSLLLLRTKPQTSRHSPSFEC